MASAFKKKSYDVIVVGGGNAGFCAAMSANEFGGSVLVLEISPKEAAGGNTTFTRGFRFTHGGKEELKKLIDDVPEEEWANVEIDSYTKDMFYNEIMRQSQGRFDPEIAEMIVNYSNPTIWWMKKMGVKWALSYDVAVNYQGKMAWHRGSGMAPQGYGAGCIEQQTKLCEAKGIEITYDAMAYKLLTDAKRRVTGVVVKTKYGSEEVHATKGVVLASGGFQSSPEMRAKYMGPGWDIVKVRGTPYDTGEGHNMALALNAKMTGEWTGAHAIQTGAEAPSDSSGLDETRPKYPFGILVDINGNRFLDEGENFDPYTYVKFGRIIIKLPNNWACQIYDQKIVPLLGPDYEHGSRPVIANTIEELAEGIGVPPATLAKTVKDYNAAVQDGKFDPKILDGKHTAGLEPPKTNWANKLDKPPFVAYPVTTGITFTFGGVQLNSNAQVLDVQNNPILGLYAAGEIHGTFYTNYVGGTGLPKGSVFGRIAGAHAMGHDVT